MKKVKHNIRGKYIQALKRQIQDMFAYNHNLFLNFRASENSEKKIIFVGNNKIIGDGTWKAALS